MRWISKSALLSAALVFASTTTRAQTTAPFVVLETDTLRDRWTSADDANESLNEILAGYIEDSAQPVPEILSVWTTYPMFGSNIGTNYIPVGNDIAGIGLESIYTEDEDGIFESEIPPMQAILLHNNIDVSEGAATHGAPVEGYARYLFLLELSHMWGPALRVPGSEPNALIGFDFHWSFYNDLPSPAGGNDWEDLGDGRFRATPLDPGSIQFSMLDLYAMGLAPADEVPPVGVLQNVTGAEHHTDPFWRRAGLTARTFPWMDASTEVIVEAERVEFTIDQIIEATGERSPAFGEEATDLSIGFVLIVEDATEPLRDELLRMHGGFFDSLVAAYHDATHERGTLRVVSQSDLRGMDAGTDPDAGADAGRDAGTIIDGGTSDGSTGEDGGGCNAGGSTSTSLGLLVVALAFLRERRRYS